MCKLWLSFLFLLVCPITLAAQEADHLRPPIKRDSILLSLAISFPSHETCHPIYAKDSLNTLTGVRCTQRIILTTAAEGQSISQLVTLSVTNPKRGKVLSPETLQMVSAFQVTTDVQGYWGGELTFVLDGPNLPVGLYRWQLKACIVILDRACQSATFLIPVLRDDP